MIINVSSEDVLLMVRFTEVANHMNRFVDVSVVQNQIKLSVIDTFHTTELNYSVDSSSSTSPSPSSCYFQIGCQDFINVIGRSCGDVQLTVEDHRWIVSTTMGSEELPVRRGPPVGGAVVGSTTSRPLFTLPATVLFKQAGSACVSVAPARVSIDDHVMHISTTSEFVTYRSVIPVPTISHCPGPTDFTFKYLKFIIPWMRKGTRVLNTYMDQTDWTLFIPTKKRDLVVILRGSK